MVIQHFPQYSTIEKQQYEKAVVYTHVGVKSLEVASIVSPVVYLALAAIGRRQRYTRVLKFSAGLFFPGMVGGAGYMLEMPEDKEKNQQRAFRLQRNLHQYYLEDWTCIGLAAGILLGFAMPRLGLLNTALLGSSMGFYASGLVLQGVRHGFVDPVVFDMTNLN